MSMMSMLLKLFFPGKARLEPMPIRWTLNLGHDKINTIKVVGARPMVGLQTLDLPIEVRILCPQPDEKHPANEQGAFSYMERS